MNIIRYVTIGAVVLIAVLVMTLFGSFVENVDANDIAVIQYPSGTLKVKSSPGYTWQWFGTVTTYKKRGIYEFGKDTGTKMRFNDGAHGYPVGSIQYELPMDEPQVVSLHTKFGSREAIEAQLVKTVVDKAIYMTGPLMSSKESYAERRNELISNVEDQVAKGVYRTRQREERIEDPITKEQRLVTVVEIVQKDGVPARQEEAWLAGFGIKTFNFSISELSYDEKVEQQIMAQQQAVMDVQTALAESKKAEQRALTVAKEGEANAARQKWEQEAIKAKQVTLAEQEKEVAVTNARKQLEVAQLNAQEAEQYKIAQIKRADGDAYAKREVMQADGALQQKLGAIVAIQREWAAAFAQRKVPATVFASGGNGSGSGTDGEVQMFMNMLMMQAAKQLQLDMSVAGK